MPRRPKSTTATPAPSIDQAGLAARIDIINRRHAEVGELATKARELANEACGLAVCIGFALLKLKEDLPHGEFGKLFRKPGGSPSNDYHGSHFTFNRQMGLRYRNAAREIQNSSGPVSAKRMLELKTAAEADPVEGSKLPAVQEVTRGLTFRKLCIALGVIPALPGEGLNEEADAEEGEETTELPEPPNAGELRLRNALHRWTELSQNLNRLLRQPPQAIQLDLFTLADSGHAKELRDLETLLDGLLNQIREARKKGVSTPKSKSLSA